MSMQEYFFKKSKAAKIRKRGSKSKEIKSILFKKWIKMFAIKLFKCRSNNFHISSENVSCHMICTFSCKMLKKKKKKKSKKIPCIIPWISLFSISW